MMANELDNKEHRYQIGDKPVYLVISRVDGKARLSFLMTRDMNGYTAEVFLHLATFQSTHHAMSVVAFLDKLVDQVNGAITHYEELAERLTKSQDITQVTQLINLEEQRNGSQN